MAKYHKGLMYYSQPYLQEVKASFLQHLPKQPLHDLQEDFSIGRNIREKLLLNLVGGDIM